ncbi:MAG: hypothetical protein GOU99_02595 [Candidatus Altiarchaeota archaeon]|nr:hypothetical protein [Candidatus Altiarchaeota archaeon]
MLRSMEAIIISIVIIGTLMTVFYVPRIETGDYDSGFVKSLLESYHNQISDYVFSSPISLIHLIEEALPRTFDSRVRITYHTSFPVYTGYSGELPIELYYLAPGSSEYEGQTMQIDSSWYRTVFSVVNSGNETIENQTLSTSISLYKLDSNEDGHFEPIDIESVRFFVDDVEADWTIQSYEEDDSKIILVIRGVLGKIEPGQSKKGYAYYLVGEDYE